MKVSLNQLGLAGESSSSMYCAKTACMDILEDIDNDYHYCYLFQVLDNQQDSVKREFIGKPGQIKNEICNDSDYLTSSCGWQTKNLSTLSETFSWCVVNYFSR